MIRWLKDRAARGGRVEKTLNPSFGNEDAYWRGYEWMDRESEDLTILELKGMKDFLICRLQQQEERLNEDR